MTKHDAVEANSDGLVGPFHIYGGGQRVTSPPKLMREQRQTPAALISNDRLVALIAWVKRHYRDRLGPNDLGDPHLIDEARAALDELTGILELGSDFYDFQRAGA